ISAFLIAIFLVSLFPSTVADITSTEETPKTTSINVGITEDKFTKTELIKSYAFNVTPGLWNITVEAGNVSIELIYLHLREQYSPSLDDYTKSWVFLGEASLIPGEVAIEPYTPIPTSGKMMLLFYFDGIVSEENWADAYHFKIHLSKTDLPAVSDGNINTYVEALTYSMYPFIVATSGWYNLTWVSNSSDFRFRILDDKNNLYVDWDNVDSGMYTFYFKEDLTYYYILNSDSNVNINITLSFYPLAGTISEGSLIVNFGALEHEKIISWTGLPEGFYQITINQTTPDVDMLIRSYSNISEMEPITDIEDNITIFLAPLRVNDWSQPLAPYFLGEDEYHWSTYVAYSNDNSGESRGDRYWSNEALAIELHKAIAFNSVPISVNLTITPLEIETLTPTKPTPAIPETMSRDSVIVTVNDTLSETAFKVLQFDAQFGYEYDIMVEPDTESYPGGVNVYSQIVMSDRYETINAFGGMNFTAYYESFNLVPGSSETHTFYIIADVFQQWGTLIFTLTELEPQEIDVGDEVSKMLTYNDYIQIYKLELKKDKAYTFELSMDEASIGLLLALSLVGEDGKINTFEAGTDALISGLYGDFVIGTFLFPLSLEEELEMPIIPSFSNKISVISLEDQTVYVALFSPPIEILPDISANLKVTEMEEPFSIEGFLAYLVLGLIPVAFIIGLLVQQKKGILK
ncbi:MAG: hypothetical protein ACFFDT_39030, partial [Candidatus Hodarchaeota archaeon]